MVLRVEVKTRECGGREQVQFLPPDNSCVARGESPHLSEPPSFHVLSPHQGDNSWLGRLKLLDRYFDQ